MSGFIFWMVFPAIVIAVAAGVCMAIIIVATELERMKK